MNATLTLAVLTSLSFFFCQSAQADLVLTDHPDGTSIIHFAQVAPNIFRGSKPLSKDDLDLTYQDLIDRAEANGVGPEIQEITTYKKMTPAEIAVANSELDYKFLRDTLHVTHILTLQYMEGNVEAERQAAARYGIQILSSRMTASPFQPSEESVNGALNYIRDFAAHPEKGVLYVHCTFARDRTGLVFALYGVSDLHQTPQQALSDWHKTGFNEYTDTKLYGLYLYLVTHTGFVLPLAPQPPPPRE